tara:strand:+ start:428 stop:643 length:216 start_codon:yes stop_codon:yes gene_type:complete
MKSNSPFRKTNDCDVRYEDYIKKNSKDRYVDDSDGVGPKTLIKAKDSKNLLSKEKYCANTRDKRIKKEQDK